MSDDASGSATAERGLAGQAPGVVSFDDTARSPVERLQHFFHAFPTTIPAIILIVSVLVFIVVTRGKFLGPLNLSLILAQVTIIGVLATAQTLVIITAGIDLSVGAIMVLSSIVMGKLAVSSGMVAVIAVSPVFMVFPDPMLAAGIFAALLGLVAGIVTGLA